MSKKIIIGIVVIASVLLTGHITYRTIQINNEITEISKQLENIDNCLGGDEQSCIVVEQYTDNN
jgi:hypothetical protein